MSIYGAMYSGVSGLSAQSNALGVISDNISNVNTVGYKGSRTSFRTLVTQATTQTTYTPGGVGSRPLQGIDKQGLLQGTSNATDLGISGNGMFVVNEAINPGVGDDVMFTRAGEFRPDEAGNLRNAAGFYLQGWPLDDNGNLPPAQQSINSVETVNVSNLSGLPRATDAISLGANLPSGAAANANLTQAGGGTQNSMTVQIFDALGNAHNLNLEFTKLGDTTGDGQVQTVTVDDTTAPNLNAAYGMAGVATPGTFDITDADGNTDTITYNTANNLATFVTNFNLQTANTGVTAAVVGAGTANAHVRFDHPTGQALTFEDNAFTQALDMSQEFVPNEWHTVVRAPTLASDPNGGPSGLLEDPTAPGTYNQTSISDRVTFNGDGSIANVGNTLSNLGISFDNNPAAPNGTNAEVTDDLALDFGTQNEFDGLTQFDSNFAVSEINQNGLRFGNFTGVNVNEEGTLTAVFDNGRRKDIYQLPIAMFSNFNGLEEVSGNAYLQTRESGDFLLSEAGVGGAGDMSPSSVEQSTVDLAEEFTRMITTQRAYSASTKVITTSDEMLQELTQAIR